VKMCIKRKKTRTYFTKDKGIKRCPKCGQIKSRSDFHKNGLTVAGYCKDCWYSYTRSNYIKKHPEARSRRIDSVLRNMPYEDRILMEVEERVNDWS